MTPQKIDTCRVLRMARLQTSLNLWPASFTKLLKVNFLTKYLALVFLKISVATCAAVRKLSSNSRTLHLTAAFAEVYAQAAGFSGQRDRPSPLLQSTIERFRKLQLLTSHSFATNIAKQS